MSYKLSPTAINLMEERPRCFWLTQKGDWKRPRMNQLVNDAKRHLFKIVIVWSQDRIARDTEQFLWFYRN
jgi:hypothetical protein